MRPDRKRMSWLAAYLMLSASVASAWAKGFEDFTLAGAIPADAYLAVHTRGHDGKVFLREQMSRVWTAIEKARFDRDLKRLFKDGAVESGMSEEEFNAAWDKAVAVCQSIDWANLASDEYAMGMRLTPMGPAMMPEFVAVMKSGALEQNFTGLSGMLQELAKLNEQELSYLSEGEGSRAINKLGFKNAPFPITFTVARFEDKLIVSFGQTMFEQSLALLDGSGGEALGKSERFQAAFKPLPAPVDMAVFFDSAKMFKQLRGMAEEAIKMMPAPPADDPSYAEHEKTVALIGKLFDAVDMVDYLATVGETADKKVLQEGVVAMREGASDTLLYKIVYSNGTLKDPLKYVPADAGNAAASAGINPAKSFDLILDFVRTNVPGGEQADGALEEFRTQSGFDLREDILGWMEGRFVSFSIPGPNAFSPGEWVTMISVSDVAKGKAFLAKVVEMVTPQLGQNGSIDPATIDGADGFYTIKSPMLAMAQMTAPTLGVHDGWLFLGSSPEIIGRTFKVAAGSEPNFAKNERFQKEGLPASEDVMAMSFTDLTQFGEQLGQALSMVGFASMMLGEQAQDPAIRTIIGTVSKMGRVVRALDFYQSASSETRMDGNLLRTKSLTNLREPPKVEKPAPSSSEAATEESSANE